MGPTESGSYAAHLLPIGGGYHQLAGMAQLFPGLRMTKSGAIAPDAIQDGFDGGLPIIRECADRCHGVVEGKIVYNCMSPTAETYTQRVNSVTCNNCPKRRGREASE